jgi:beta-glucosidase
MTDGSMNGGVNKEGVRYYNNLIDELLLKGRPCMHKVA